MVQKLGKGALLAKADIQSAFRLIKRYSPGTDFGIRARGEERKVGKGGGKKGSKIRPREISFESFSLTAFPFCKALFELEHEVGILREKMQIWA
jgi:hypothetical protein